MTRRDTYPCAPLPVHLGASGQSVDITPVIVGEEQGDVLWRVKSGVIVRRNLLVQGPHLCCHSIS